MLTESYSGGSLNGLSVNSVYDNKLRRTTAEIKDGANVVQGVTHAYDNAGRLQTVTDASAISYTAAYAYHANSHLVNTVTFKQSLTTRVLTSRAYDNLNRLQSISSTAYGSSAPSLSVSFGYQYNDSNQRVRANLADGSYSVYTYDELGQVISGRKYWSDGTPVAGEQFEYGFDDIGNRDWTGGRASAQSDYAVPNALNQYTSRTVPGVVDVLGLANPTANVTVNGNVANRRGEYFHWPLAVNNSSAAQYPTITVTSQYGSTQSDSGEAFVPYATESFGHDSDGNLTSDGRWTYIWDGENRLIEMKRDTSSPTLSSRQRLVFEYDHQGRRIRKTFYTHNESDWVEDTDTVFLYDGWNLMGELNANSSNDEVRTYIWGLDLSGSEQGAGGVGGLLKVTDYTSGTTHHFVGYDGNGNVAALFDGTTGAATARYEYGPFGEPLRTTGTLAEKCPFRFSTKYTDNESGLVYYGYRSYNPSTGRWLSRDPIGENGGENLYGFVHNDAIDIVDLTGLGDENHVPPIEIRLPPSSPFPPIGGIPPGPLPPISFPPIGTWPPLPPAPPKPTPPGYPILIPPPPPRNPPSAPPRQPPGGAPTNPGTAAGGAIVLCANMAGDIFNRWEYNDGKKECRRQAESQSTGEKCCVMLFCSRCCGGRTLITRVSTHLSGKTCDEAKASWYGPGDSLKTKCPGKSETLVPQFMTMIKLTGGIILE